MTGRAATLGWAWWAAFTAALTVVFLCGFILGSGI